MCVSVAILHRQQTFNGANGALRTPCFKGTDREKTLVVDS